MLQNWYSLVATSRMYYITQSSDTAINQVMHVIFKHIQATA